MITIEIGATPLHELQTWTAITSHAATFWIREALASAESHQAPRLFIRVTGPTTAAACRKPVTS